ncbi:D-aminoacyl-tRNA deacylase [Gilvimarinus sp. F26214L]|uniref:D-aminoacyl-tRNA deacylase n=1 Tax=Gilvimarinus sp. DZF01 TaxID=3461371 RepID=UPI0040467231
MRGLLQRVSQAEVQVEGRSVGAIGRGLLVFLGVEKGDGEEQADKLLHKLVNYRVFPDSEGKMNLSLLDVQGGILVVSQFTLAADTGRGLRPSFSSAAPPAEAERLYELFLEKLAALREQGLQVASGRFAADMQVSLINDGPVTFLLSA